MRVTITGGAGFIGTNVAEFWAREGCQISILDDLSRAGSERNLEYLRQEHGRCLDFIHADACDSGAVREAVKNADLVFHFASQVAVTLSLLDPVKDFRSNAESTLTALEAVRAHAPHAAFFYTSTNKVYGELSHMRLQEVETRYLAPDHPNGVDENCPLDFHSPYGCSKGAGDQYVHDYARIFGLKTVVFRMSCIYGGHQWGSEDQGWVVHFARSILQGKRITLCGDGKQVRDLLHISDLVNAFHLAYKHIGRTAGEVFNIGGGADRSLSVLELIDLVEEKTCRKADIAHENWRQGDQRFYCSDTSKAQRCFQWEPIIMPEEGLDQVLAWCGQE